ncbi:MAG: tetratricopeptide repeat protein, partial [Rhodobacteraceae bacterium]|nr:tetratricopeptide repeat protein [Paracoccaceae bacterium]
AKALSDGQLDSAGQHFSAAAELAPERPEGWHNLGLVMARKGEADTAIVNLKRAMEIAPRDPVMSRNFAMILKSAGRIEESTDAFRRALGLNKEDAELWESAGVVLLQQRQFKEAADVLAHASKLAPASPAVRSNLGLALNAIGKADEAQAHLEEALRLAPNFAEAYLNLGTLRQAQHDVEGAIQNYQRALAAGARKEQVFFDLSTAYGLNQDFDASLKYLDKAIEIDPVYAEARRNRGMLHLMSQRYSAGWPDYEWRWSCADFAGRQRPFHQPRWQGQTIDGRLLVWSEQGIGDEILYSRMIPDLMARGINAVFEVDPRLVNLMARSFPGIDVVPRATPPARRCGDPDIVAQIPSGSLGQFLRTEEAQFRSAPRQTLQPERNRVQHFRQAIGAGPAEPVVGLSWRSANPELGPQKSIEISKLERILKIPNRRFVSLQYGDSQSDRAAAYRQTGVEIAHIPDLGLTSDFDEVAAITAACDVVLTVSNSTAHMAGALGVPTIVMVPQGSAKFWYWGTDRELTPWYPSVSILRQAAPGAWDEVIGRAVERLHALTKN